MKQSALNEEFDQVFVINLEREKGKRLKVANALRKNKINHTFWLAEDGYSESNLKEFKKYQSIEFGELHFKEFAQQEIYRQSKLIESPGAWGILKSYKKLLEYSVHNGFNKILVLEDDVILHHDFEQQYKTFIEKITPNWKIILFGASQHNWSGINEEDSLNNGYYHPVLDHTLGAFALGIESSIFKEFINLISYMESPLDQIPLGKIFESYSEECFVVFPNIIIPDVSSSTIRAARDQESHSKKMKWPLKNFSYPAKKPLISVIIASGECITELDFLNGKLTQLFSINWLIWNGEYFLPVHNHQSEALKWATSNDKLTKEDINKTLSGNPSDFTLKLTNGHPIKEDEFSEELEKLIIENKCPKNCVLILNERLHSSNETVSIIVPTYNRSENLTAAIKSIQTQTYEKLEIIIVDDNDPGLEKDATKKIVESFLGDERIKYIPHSKNMNGATARNTGIMKSTGSYIGFLDDDDVYLPDKITSCIEVLNNKRFDVGGVYGGFIGWNSPEEDLSRYKFGDLTIDLLTLSFKNHYLHTNTALYTREAVLAVNGFDDSFKRHQDLEFNIRFFQKFKIDVVKQVVAHLRPVEPKNSNRVLGKEMFLLKEKFLLRFNKIISKQPNDIQDQIYIAQWEEAKNCCLDEKEFLEICVDQDKPGILKYLTLTESLEKLKANVLDQRSEKNITLNYLSSELDKLNGQIKWYSDTYDHLPKWFLKIGGVFRRWPFATKK